MGRRRQTTGDGSDEKVAVGSNGAATSRSSGGGSRCWKTVKLFLFLAAFLGLYTYINSQEKKSIMQSRGSVSKVGGSSTVEDSKGKQESSKKEVKKSKSSAEKETKSTNKRPTTNKSSDESNESEDNDTIAPKPPAIKGTSTSKFILKPDSEFTPEMVWLMSFPNSGTSFTMSMVARASNRAFATNYADEVLAPDDEESLSIYPRRPEGPFWVGKSGKIATPRDLPDKYVITKTHCGSRCMECGPDVYKEGAELFLKRCTTGHARVRPDRRRVDVEYPANRVAKAIHLIRNPMHNLIARYHLEHRHKGYKNNTDWLSQHSNDVAGLQAHCKDLDEQYREEDEAFFGKDKIPEAPCHGEFYKWAQWHNLAHESLALPDVRENLPVLTVYYEDYSDDFNKTVTKILDFLELEQVGVLREFQTRTDYGGYFTDDQLANIKKLVKRVSSERTWAEVEHYFEGIGH